MNKNFNSAIITPFDVAKFFIHIVFDLRKDFHPDDTFHECDDFSEEEADAYDNIMDDCHLVCKNCKVDIYNIASRIVALFHYCNKNDVFCKFLDSLLSAAEEENNDECLDMKGQKIIPGAQVIWYDPELSARSLNRVWTVDDCEGEIVRISDEFGEAEVFPKELRVIG